MDITKIKLPKLSTACCCISLRKGLLALGYVNLVFHAALFALVMILALETLILYGMGNQIPPLELILLVPILVLCIGVYSLLIVIAVHLNEVKLLRNVMIAGTVLWIFVILYSLCLGSRIIKFCIKENAKPIGYAILLFPLILEPFFQGYVLLLLRSMIMKLQEEDQTVEYVNFNNKKEEECDLSSLSNHSLQCLIK